MHRFSGARQGALLIGWLALLPAAPGAELSPGAITFAPGYEAEFSNAYGAQEVPALRSQILDSVAQSLHAAHGRCARSLDVVLERAAPTHPTMKQQNDDPSLDPIRTVFRTGGAALTGHVLDDSGQVLATVTYKYFTDSLRPISPARDPWSEARNAIGQFSSRLVDACTKQSNPPPS